ncbi:MAG TPA: Rossmann-like and DUF2520 domain-containing protein [Pyrinomonadaceae bacterium]|jgi:Uncharacterized conserved protein|nr:Rossmann-like and DUF2520 domain-containing protein [Pyrinomonadaceae bacterium]
MPKRTLSKATTVVIIGPGRLGTALATGLSQRGYHIQTLIGRRASSLKKAAAVLDVPVQLLAAKDTDKFTVTDLVIVATPDDEIPTVVNGLLRHKAASTVLHTSGALSSVVLSPLAAQGWAVGSIHPLVSVSDPVVGARSFKGAFWCVEGGRQALRISRRLVRDLGGHSFSIKSAAKPLYHAAAVMTSGNIVALFDVAIDMLVKCGLKRSEARRVLLPLLESTITNLTIKVPAKAMTGTFARGDLATVERHLDALSQKDFADARSLYRLLGQRALALAADNGLDRDVVRRIRARLER